MNETLEEEFERLSEEGVCCSQTMIIKALEFRGEHNPTLVEAARGLCGGMRSGLTCGALSGADCFLALNAGEQRDELMVKLNEWFYNEFGSHDCRVITDSGDPEKKKGVCPALRLSTYRQVLRLMESLKEDE